MIGICLDRYVFDRENFPRQIQRFGQFINQHGRRAAADVNSFEFIIFFLINFNLPGAEPENISGQLIRQILSCEKNNRDRALRKKERADKEGAACHLCRR